MSIVGLIIALLVTFFAAAIQGVVGVGFAMVSVPILALIDPALAPVPQLLVTIPLTISMAWRERTHIQFSNVTWIVAGRVPGVLIGVGMLAVATQRSLDLAIAAMVLLAVAIIASGYSVRRTRSTEFGAGALSGILSFVASIGGPPLALLYSRDDGPTRRSNLAVVFTIGLTVTLVARIASGNMTWDDVVVALILFPALAVGYAASLRFKSLVPQKLAKATILVLSTAGAVGLIMRAIA
ncbi:MAG: sulfite exporter TauE/SafE family protein [Acidimicrobiia bacterium]